MKRSKNAVGCGFQDFSSHADITSVGSFNRYSNQTLVFERVSRPRTRYGIQRLIASHRHSSFPIPTLASSFTQHGLPILPAFHLGSPPHKEWTRIDLR